MLQLTSSAHFQDQENLVNTKKKSKKSNKRTVLSKLDGNVPLNKSRQDELERLKKENEELQRLKKENEELKKETEELQQESEISQMNFQEDELEDNYLNQQLKREPNRIRLIQKLVQDNEQLKLEKEFYKTSYNNLFIKAHQIQEELMALKELKNELPSFVMETKHQEDKEDKEDEEDKELFDKLKNNPKRIRTLMKARYENDGLFENTHPIF